MPLALSIIGNRHIIDTADMIPEKYQIHNKNRGDIIIHTITDATVIGTNSLE